MVHNVPPPEPHPTYKWSYYVNDHFSMTFPRDFDFHAAAYVPIEVASLVELFAPVHDKLYEASLLQSKQIMLTKVQLSWRPSRYRRCDGVCCRDWHCLEAMV